MKLKIVQPILMGNDSIAAENKKLLDGKSIYAFNVVSSPGAGKTTFLRSLIETLAPTTRIGVIVGDMEDTVDAERLSLPGVQSVQLNTRSACHLDASMVREGMKEIDLDAIDLLIIENVGNLVCPSDFFLGEDLRLVLLSTAEGDDKPRKYPVTFLRADAVVINKIDLIPYLNFKLDKAIADIKGINPGVKFFQTTATRRETLMDFVFFLQERMRMKRESLRG